MLAKVMLIQQHKNKKDLLGRSRENSTKNWWCGTKKFIVYNVHIVNNWMHTQTLIITIQIFLKLLKTNRWEVMSIDFNYLKKQSVVTKKLIYYFDFIKKCN